MNKKVLCLFFWIISVYSLNAQNISIKGCVKDNADLAMELVNVVLQKQDSFVMGTVTNEKGEFYLNKIKRGNYRLIISSIGFVTDVTELYDLSASIDLGKLILKEDQNVLDEVTITTSNIVNKADRKVIFPNKQQLKASTNGVNLLNSLQLPRVEVNIINNTISLATKESVQLLLNGVKVTEQELMSIQPSDIIRIEYMENPGLRYDNAAVVLNYITRRHESGGAVGFNVLQSPYRAFGNYNFSSKVNYKKSEFGVNYESQFRKFKEVYRENSEHFLLDDESYISREEIGDPGLFKRSTHQLLLNYNAQISENDYFNMTLGYSAPMVPNQDYRSKILFSRYPDQQIQMIDLDKTKNNIPKIDLYWSHLFKNKQSITVNVVGTYIDSYNKRIYQEILDNKYLTDILSVINGNKYSIIGEAIYEKGWNVGRLNAGLKHSYAYLDNTYTGSANYVNKMKEANTYAYLQFSGGVKKLNYVVGVGLYRTWLRQLDVNSYENYTFRPTLTLTYAPVDKFYVSLGGLIENYSPSLGDLSMVEQYIDSLQIRRGNPNLTPYKSYRLNLNTEFRFGKNSLSFWGMYTNMPDAIMENTYREGNWFIRTNENQKRMQQIMASMTFKTRLFRDIINFSLTGGVNHFISDGHTYKHTYTNYYYRASLFASYKQWVLAYNQYSAFNTFWGEQIYGGENGQELMLVYQHKNLNLGIGMVNPFTTTKTKIENFNQYAPFRKVNSVEDASHMVVLQFSWNFSFGRKYKAIEKKINNSDTNSGIMKAGK